MLFSRDCLLPILCQETYIQSMTMMATMIYAQSDEAQSTTPERTNLGNAPESPTSLLHLVQPAHSEEKSIKKPTRVEDHESQEPRLTKDKSVQETPHNSASAETWNGTAKAKAPQPEAESIEKSNHETSSTNVDQIVPQQKANVVDPDEDIKTREAAAGKSSEKNATPSEPIANGSLITDNTRMQVGNGKESWKKDEHLAPSKKGSSWMSRSLQERLNRPHSRDIEMGLPTTGSVNKKTLDGVTYIRTISQTTAENHKDYLKAAASFRSDAKIQVEGFIQDLPSTTKEPDDMTNNRTEIGRLQ